MAFSPDGHTALTAGHDRAVHVWDMQNDDADWAPVETPGFRARGSIQSRADYLALTGSTRRCWAIVGFEIGEVCDSEPLRHTNQVWAVAFSPDGKTVVTGWARSRRENLERNDRCFSWDSIAIIRRMSFQFPFHRMASTLITGCLDGSARIWDVRTKALHRCNSHWHADLCRGIQSRWA